MFRQVAGQSAQRLQVRFAGFRAFVVGHAGDDGAARRALRDRTREQGTGLVALARRQHEHAWVTRAIVGMRIADHPAVALKRIGRWPERLLADQPGAGCRTQGHAGASAQEQRGPRVGATSLRPGQQAGVERQAEDVEDGIAVVSGHGGSGWTSASADCTGRTVRFPAPPRIM